MLTLRRAGERLHETNGTHEAWLTFHAEDRADRLARQLQPLELLREGRLQPRAAIREPHGHRKVITYVREGTVTFEDATGDGVAVTDQRAVTLSITEPAEILLLELGAVELRQHLLQGSA